MGEREFLIFLALLSAVESLRIVLSSCADPTLEIPPSLVGAVTLVWLLGKRFIRVCHSEPPEGTIPEGLSDALQHFLDDVKKLG